MDILVFLGAVVIVLLALGCISVANYGEEDADKTQSPSTRNWYSPTVNYTIDLSGKRNITDNKLMCLFIEQIGMEEIERIKNKNANTVFVIRGTRNTTRQIYRVKRRIAYTVLEIRVTYDDLMSAYTSKANRQRERNKLTSSLRLEVKRRDNYTCRYCGKKMFDGVGLQIDHIIPIAKGGKTELGNLQVLCSVCNRNKSDRIVPTMETVSATETVSIEEEAVSTTETVSIEEEKAEPKAEPLNKRVTDEEYAKFMQETRDFIRRNRKS